ncbi:uncharacterized protein LOC115768103 [Drosophila novamexicana]|uniref:uncharacterized protein LOC115768103 n=1 Tax=Drosophila novamexicana TaxID=47314 RepID=UPI0011E5E54B|nr:uncharacterized protein LOC115768103 [Drosophila novamexicana]
MWALLGILVGLFNSTTTTTTTLEASLDVSDISCLIATTESAQTTYIYRCFSCPAANSVTYLTLEQKLYRCVASQLPSCMRSIEAHEIEPIHQTSSMNIFHIPAGDAGQPLVRRIVDMLNARQPRRHVHKYLFVWPEASEQQLRQLFEECWRKQLLFALAIIHQEGIYDFQPFGEEGLELKKVSSDAFYIDKLRNLHGYELRFSMFTHPLRALPLNPVESAGYEAIDGSVARLLAKKLNATARYVVPRDGEAYGRCLENGSFTGVVQDLVNGETHIALNIRFVLECMMPLLESLYPYTRTVLSLVVPAAGLQPEYLIFVTAFRNSVWHLLLANFLIAFVLFLILQWLLESIVGDAGSHWYDIFEMLFKTHLGQPVDRFSRISSLRAFLMGWILFSYVLTSIYFGKLESSFVQPNYEPQINSLDELPPHGLRVHGIDTMFEAVSLSLSERHYRLLTANHRVHPLRDSEHFFELLISRRYKKDVFIMRDDKAREFLALTYNAEADRPAYHIVKQYLRSMPSTYVLPLGSPFLYKFQRMLSNFYEHGLFEYWLRRDVVQRSRTSQSDEFFEDLGAQADLEAEDADFEEWRQKRVVLTLDILQGAFYLWVIGIILSIFGFLLEQGYFQWRRMQRGTLFHV